MRVLYIRHAQSENNHLWDTTGSSNGRSDDPLLTETGIEQAKCVAEFLRKGVTSDSPTRDLVRIDDFRVTHIYCSLMVRAVATASAIAQALGLTLVGRDDLFEVGGIYTEDTASGELVGRPGRTRAYLAAHYPGIILPENVTDQGWYNRPFEVAADRLRRANSAWQDLLARHGDSEDHVVLVSHGGFYNYLLAAALSLPDPATSHHGFAMNNVAISRLDVRQGETGVIYSNRVDFLPREIVT